MREAGSLYLQEGCQPTNTCVLVGVYMDLQGLLERTAVDEEGARGCHPHASVHSITRV